MKVILKQDIKDLGKGGDLIDVKDGYARNYLIPQGLVAPATSKNMKQVGHERSVIADQLKKERLTAQELAARIQNVSCTIAKRVGENNRLFGSVTTKDIEESLREEGLVIPRRAIQLADNIKELGVYDVAIQLHPDVAASLKVWVVAK
ncbi:MAG: 50S ribosomal protein L9 [Myxococcales bacterium]|nr:MAG: 50S ribosomal protein L9 [Myxococcales bacterium]